jgi:hypothetical protein
VCEENPRNRPHPPLRRKTGSWPLLDKQVPVPTSPISRTYQELAIKTTAELSEGRLERGPRRRGPPGDLRICSSKLVVFAFLSFQTIVDELLHLSILDPRRIVA